jgi:hypothetical protein
VQRELAHVWQYFDPDHYARRVLADAPLDGGAVHVTHAALLPAVRHLRHLTALRVTLDGVTNLDALASGPALTRLDLDNVEEIDLAALGDQPQLRHLQVGENVQRVHGLSALARMRALEALWLPVHDPLPDLRFVTKLPNLFDLWISDVEDAANRELLTELPKLGMISFYRNTNPLDPDLIRRLPQLTYVATRFTCGDTDLHPFAEALHELPNLIDVGLWDCSRLTDLNPLAGLPLQRLRLTGARELCDLRALASLAQLRHLILTHSPVTDLGPLAELQHLQELVGS